MKNGDQIFFKSFELDKLDDFCKFVLDNKIVQDNDTIHATGGGSYKFQSIFD